MQDTVDQQNRAAEKDVEGAPRRHEITCGVSNSPIRSSKLPDGRRQHSGNPQDSYEL